MAKSPLIRMGRRELCTSAATVWLAGCAGAPAPPMAFALQTRVAVADASLYLEVRGRSSDAPVLLWLHGGPGAAERPLFRLFDGALEDDFIVASLDQRGAGRSFDPSADPARLSIGQHLADLDAVISRLRALTSVTKIILVGHSWGGALGLLHARDHPDTVAAVVGVAPLVNEAERQRSQWGFVQEEALRRSDTTALERLSRIGPPPFTGARELQVQDLVDRFGGYARHPPGRLLTVVRALLGGLVTPGEIARIIKGNTVSLEAMTPELFTLDLGAQAPRLAVPVAFMLGRFDRQVDPGLAAIYFDALAAPRKHLIWLETGHDIPFESPAAFQSELRAALTAIDVWPHRP